MLARVAPRGVFKCWSVTCRLHQADGERCNKSLSLGTEYSSEEARRRIKEWCLRGCPIPDLPGGKRRHMDECPRTFDPATIRSEAELDALAARLPPVRPAR